MTETQPRKYSLFPKPLAQVVEPLTRPVFKARGLAGTRLITDWAHIVGPTLARCTAPEKLSFPKGKTSNGTLTVAVENGFSTEIMHLQPVILERLAGYFGYKAVSRLVVSPNPLSAAKEPSARHASFSLDKKSFEAAEAVEDRELREALQSLARTLSGAAT